MCVSLVSVPPGRQYAELLLKKQKKSRGYVAMRDVAWRGAMERRSRAWAALGRW